LNLGAANEGMTLLQKSLALNFANMNVLWLVQNFIRNNRPVFFQRIIKQALFDLQVWWKTFLLLLFFTVIGWAILQTYGSTPQSILYILLFSILTAEAYINYYSMITLNKITFLIVALGLVGSLSVGLASNFSTDQVPVAQSVLYSLAGGIIGAGILFAIAVLSPKGMGMGTVKLMGGLGTFLGLKILIALFLTFIFGVLFVGLLVGAGLINYLVQNLRGKVIFIERRNFLRHSEIPISLPMMAASYVTLIYGGQLWQLYQQYLH
jgi:prepilin signal peptidase PulO-like enzyme (type II secretory pathway)